MIAAITKVLNSYPEVALGYLFGSRASGNTGPLSDYDIAVYLDESDSQKRGQIRLKLITELSKALGSDNVDLVVLNNIDQPALKYNIITTGQLLVEREPFQLLVEPPIYNEYFDFQSSLKRHNLTKTL